MLPLLPLRFELKQHENLHLPEHAGSMLRGSFGHTFKKLACITKQKECKTCPLSQSCAYSQVFEGVINSEEQSSLPYIIHMPKEANRFIAAGQTWSFGMTLVGKAINQLPIIAYAWQKTCEEGFSKDRSKAELMAIYHHDQIIYQPNKPLATHTPNDIEAKPLKSVVHLDFVSPLRIQHNNYVVLNPEELTAPIVLIALAKRIQRLAELHAILPSHQRRDWLLNSQDALPEEFERIIINCMSNVAAQTQQEAKQQQLANQRQHLSLIHI